MNAAIDWASVAKFPPFRTVTDRVRFTRAWAEHCQLQRWADTASDHEREPEPEPAPDADAKPFAAPWSNLAAVAASIGTLRDWRVEGAIEGPALVVLAAGEKIGKSWMAIDLALAAATGGKWLGHFRALRSGPVLYLDGEYGEHEFARRLVRLARGAGANTSLALARVKHLYSPAVTLRPTDDAYRGVLADARRIRPALVIVDPLRNHLEGDENSARDMLVAFEALRALRDALECPVVALHHLNKSGNASGSRALCGRADLLFEGSDAEAPTFTVRGRTVRATDPLASPFTIEIAHDDDADDSRARTRVTCEASAAAGAKPLTLRDKIVACLEKCAPEGRSVEFIRKAVGRNATDVKAALEGMPQVEGCACHWKGNHFDGWRLVGTPDETPDVPNPDETPDEPPTNSGRS